MKEYTNKPDLLKHLHSNLISLKAVPIQERYPKKGICSYMFDGVNSRGTLILSYEKEEEALLYQSWSLYSGNSLYPVPAPFYITGYSNPASYAYAHLPYWEGTYGLSRESLLDHLLIELPKFI